MSFDVSTAGATPTPVRTGEATGGSPSGASPRSSASAGGPGDSVTLSLEAKALSGKGMATSPDPDGDGRVEFKLSYAELLALSTGSQGPAAQGTGAASDA